MDFAATGTASADCRLGTGTNASSIYRTRTVRDGHVVEAAYKEPFDLLFSEPKFEYDDVVVRAGGLEPPRCFHQQDLNLPRIPIPPRPLKRMVAGQFPRRRQSALGPLGRRIRCPQWVRHQGPS